MIEQGKVYGDYEVVAPLGRGGLATVYLVRHRDSEQLSALKVLDVPGSTVRRRLLREARVQSELRHPNVVSVLEVMVVDEAPALVLELVRGPSLLTLLRDHRPSRAQQDNLARGILTGVAAAHARGWIHRDLKPANVLVDVSEEGLVAKVSDFGLVKIVESSGAVMTFTGAMVGTPRYTAPEQLEDASRVDARSDVFSLGAVLYRLVTGNLAFPGTIREVVQRVVSGTYTPVREVDPSVPERMATAIAAALAVDPADRPEDAQALLDLWCAGTEPLAETLTSRDLDRVRSLAPFGVWGGERDTPVPQPLDLERFDPYLDTRDEAAEPRRLPSWPWLLAAWVMMTLALTLFFAGWWRA